MTDEVFTNIERVIRENGYYTYRMFPTSNTKCINFMVMPLEGIEKEPAWTEPKPFSIGPVIQMTDYATATDNLPE